MKKYQKGFSPLQIIGLVAIVCIVVLFVYKNFGISKPAVSLPSFEVKESSIVLVSARAGEKLTLTKSPTVEPTYTGLTGVFLEKSRDEFSRSLYEQAWSPDVIKLAYVDSFSGVQQLVFVDVLKKTVNESLTAKSTVIVPLKTSLSWSPSSDKIAYIELESYGTGAGYPAQLKVVNVKTGAVQDLGSFGAPSNITWMNNSSINFTEHDVTGETERHLSVSI